MNCSIIQDQKPGFYLDLTRSNYFLKSPSKFCNLDETLKIVFYKLLVNHVHCCHESSLESFAKNTKENMKAGLGYPKIFEDVASNGSGFRFSQNLTVKSVEVRGPDGVSSCLFIVIYIII